MIAPCVLSVSKLSNASTIIMTILIQPLFGHLEAILNYCVHVINKLITENDMVAVLNLKQTFLNYDDIDEGIKYGVTLFSFLCSTLHNQIIQFHSGSYGDMKVLKTIRWKI